MVDLKYENSWRKFQSEYIVQIKRKDRVLKTIKAITGTLLLLSVIIVLGFIFKSFVSGPLTSYFKKHKTGSTADRRTEQNLPIQLSRNQLASIIDSTELARTDKNIFFIDTPDHSYKVTTSIDVYLQGYLLSVLARLKRINRGKPQRIAFVVIEPDTGKIIAMTGFDLDNEKKNPCTDSDYPAASLFKIITACAAIESLGYTPATQLHFNGSKYTLYKRQLREVKNKYSYRISFSRSFAESINPVFGKIGKNKLGRKKLDFYARAFGFNQQIDTELPFYSGEFKTNDSEYHLAELGCGFNNDTTISPLFGAMLSAAIINSGRLMMPSIVEHVTDDDGKVIYKNKKATYKTAISSKTASTMVNLMQKTVSGGTARKSFRGASRDRVLSALLIGGKTGSLYNKQHTVKYDWFTGFGKEKKTDKKIALAIVVGHRKYIGTRASTYAKMILKQYFKSHEKTAQL